MKLSIFFFSLLLSISLILLLASRPKQKKVSIGLVSVLSLIAVLSSLWIKDFVSEIVNRETYRMIDETYAQLHVLMAKNNIEESLTLMVPEYRALLINKPGLMEGFKLRFERLGMPETALYPSRKITLSGNTAILEIRNISEIGFTYEVPFIKQGDKWYIGGDLQVLTSG
jgi:hypothetical protein